MMYKRIFNLITLTLLTGIAAAGSFPSPIGNPAGFRNAMHSESIPKFAVGGAVVPAIFSKSQVTALKANFDDLAVSETISPANFTQDKSDIARLKGGRMVAVWEDNRLGPVAIAAQVFQKQPRIT